ncbi:hypothetical protein COV11_01395, partial [Candidatus Woesearchaeota archaeon CG10_big_fil_rev_8_21_14_0_10_30_7]
KEGVYWPRNDPVVVSSVIDPVTIATEKTAPKWSIDSVMNAVNDQNLGTCLVGLAVLVDNKNKKDGKYNPVATTWARETTVLSAAKMMFLGVPSPPEVIWNVSADVEEYGKKVLANYADLVSEHSNTQEPVDVTPATVERLLKNSDDPRRCVHLCTNLFTGNYYHWAVTEDKNDELKVVEFNAKEIVTTKQYQNNPSLVLGKV